MVDSTSSDDGGGESSGSDRATLLAAMAEANAKLAALPYERAIHACLVCLREGENVLGKEGNPSGRNRVCSPECKSEFDKWIAVRRSSTGTSPQAGEAKGV